MKSLKLGDKKRRRLLRNSMIFAVVVLMLAVPAQAEKKKRRVSKKRIEGEYIIETRGGKTVKYKKKTSYDFEGLGVEGIYNKPSGAYISNIKNVKARSIIRIRKDFDEEVVDSTRSLY